MFDIPVFFIDHRIDQDADERTIKRAYAKALKQIDQDNDLEGFQNLRESYERALTWARSKEWREQYIVQQNAEPEQSSEMDSVEDQVVTQSHEVAPVVGELDLKSELASVQIPDEIAAEVPVSLEQNSQNKASNNGKHEEEKVVYAIDIARCIFSEFLPHLSKKTEEVGRAESLLHLYLDDERLINVEIRDLFEWLIAEHLAQGWQVGNGDLFGAAVKCFSWSKDKHRLLRFQDFGYYLDRAVDEMSAFNSQEEARSNRQISLIRHARNDVPPTKQFLRENIYFVGDMLSSYPTWLAMVTKVDNLQNWHKLAEEYKIFQPPKLQLGGVKDWLDDSSIPVRLIIFFVFALLSVIRYSSDSSNKTENITTSTPAIVSMSAPAHELFLQGERFLNGSSGVEKNEDSALKYFKAAKEKNYFYGNIGLARIYRNKDSKYYAPEMAHKLLLDAANVGMSEAWFGVASNFEEGNGTEKDVEKATYWYTRAANFGNAAAMNNLAVKYQNGRGVKLDRKQAVTLYESAAKKGNSMAQFNIGLIYLEGRLDVKKDEEAGSNWLRLSAINGNASAQYIYAEITEHGKYRVPKNLEAAEVWYVKAKENGNANANEALARICEKLKRTNCASSEPVKHSLNQSKVKV